MQLAKLFQTQKVLRDRIDYDKSDRFLKLVLALHVELGECANEWRGFKFWSQDQQPRTLKARSPYINYEDADFYNPLLEEYVDGLHFILELGLEKTYELRIQKVRPIKTSDVSRQFILLFDAISLFYFNPSFEYYVRILSEYYGLGEMLGFTWEQIEAAYFEKNKINHHRQEVGY